MLKRKCGGTWKTWMGIKKILIKSMAATRPELWMPIGHASILMYHGVLPAGQPSRDWGRVTLDVFETQMKFIHRHYRPISMDSLARHLHERKPLPPRSVVVTFDDGLSSNAEIAAPILRRYSIDATIFAVSSFIGSGRMLWIDRLGLFQDILSKSEPEKWREVLETLKQEFGIDTGGDACRLVAVMKRTPFAVKERVMDWLVRHLGEWDDRPEAANYMPLSIEQLRELDADPLFTIGAHTLGHEIISQCDPEETRRQIITGKADLESMLGHPVTHFAFPNGRPDNFRVSDTGMVSEAGFLSSCTTCYGNVKPHHDPFDLPRVSVGNETISFELMRLGLSGLYPSLLAMAHRFRAGGCQPDD